MSTPRRRRRLGQDLGCIPLLDFTLHNSTPFSPLPLQRRRIHILAPLLRVLHKPVDDLSRIEVLDSALLFLCNRAEEVERRHDQSREELFMDAQIGHLHYAGLRDAFADRREKMHAIDRSIDRKEATKGLN